MVPHAIAQFYGANQELLWLTTLLLDLGCTVVLYRLYGKAGLHVAIATAIILANLQGPKLTVIFGVQTSLGVIFYSSIFFATDLLSENYGKAAATQAVRMGFAVSIIVLLMMSIGLMYLPSDRPETAEFSHKIHEAFVTIVNFTPRFVFGSLLAYVISQNFDVWAFHRIKRATGEKWLWLRNNLSTMSSQVVDTAIYSLVVWWGTVDLETALQLGAAKYVFKLAIAAIDTIFIYWARAMQMPREVETAGADRSGIQ
jgi:queuosine precursor transporter